MAVRVQIPKKAALVRFALHPWGRAFLVLFLLVNIVCLSAFVFYYVRYAKLINEKLVAGPFANTSMLFAAPGSIAVGDELTPVEIAAALRRSGYSDSKKISKLGWYNLRMDAIEIFPGTQSYFNDDEAVIKFASGKVAKVISLRDNSERSQYMLEPELITNLFDRSREKRRIVTFDHLPPVLVNAVISAEDKRFFKHSGFDPLRILKAAYIDIKAGRHAQGASTLSMQLARSFWLTQEKTIKRKLAEVMITFHLEQKLSKEKIFEYYANQIDIGRRGSFAIRGFGEAAQAFFGKDVRDLSLPEAATLAGLIQRPSYTNPVRWPERARGRRNVVLMLMRENGYISDREYAKAVESPLLVARSGSESTDAPYFVDLVNESLLERFQEHDFQTKSYRVYTTLDLNLQRDATEAVRLGMREVDEAIRRRTKKGKVAREPQVVLVALDPSTGQVKALVGGRDYGASQLNRASAKRQPGSSFKPFVFAAALNSAINGSAEVITPATMMVDEPTTFYHDERPYKPSNFGNKFYGEVTVRQALAKSLNIPTIHLGELAGFESVVELARKAGLNMDIRPTPAMTLGAYETTPLEVAGAYTMFADKGLAAKPSWITTIRTERGSPVFEAQTDRKQVLDPRVNYLMVSLMQEVMRSGTGAGVRSRGFVLPSAGKTGSSRDGWFAGFTSKLVCVVWVGYDDNADIGLEGARSALPVWVEFMKRAHQHREYRSVTNWDAPDGIVSVDIDPLTGQLATAACPSARPEVFISGSQPVELCRLHGGGMTQVAGWETAPAPQQPKDATPAPFPQVDSAAPPLVNSGPPPATAEGEKARANKGIFGKIKDIFK